MREDRRVITRGRVIGGVVLLLLLALGWSVYLAVQTQRDLSRARDAVDALQVAVEVGDPAARQAAVEQLSSAAASAHDRTDGPWWSVMELLPGYGDDLAGVEALAASLDVLSADALTPAVDAVDRLDGLATGDGVDLRVLAGLAPTVSRASDAVDRARALVDAEPTDGFVGALREPYQEYVDVISGLDDGLRAATRGLAIAPEMLGADGPRNYLLVFQNNAEIRATGGLPGSWALVSAVDGRLTIERQGAATDFPVYGTDGPVTDLTPAERALFNAQMGQFFQNPNVTPDFPRAAQVFRSFWDRSYPDTPIDGVVSLDTVGLSYLLEGTGPVPVGDLTLSAEGAVSSLLNEVYIKVPDPAEQDAFFQLAARSIFTAVTGDIESPYRLLTGLERAGSEGRFLVAPFDPELAQVLAGTRVEGALDRGDDDVAYVDVALNDATASKMSYYLRYRGELETVGCRDGRLALSASLAMGQTISAADAAALPPYITGGGTNFPEIGRQTVNVFLFAPAGGTFTSLTINGRDITLPEPIVLEGRPAMQVQIEVARADDALVTWEMTAGPGQTAGAEMRLTPSIIPGEQRETAPGCS